MSGPHIADLDTAYRSGRDAAVTETRTFGAEWASYTYGDSRLCKDAFGVLALMNTRGEAFAVVPLGDSITTEGEGVDKVRTQSYLFVIAQRGGDKTDEDLFFDRVERWENRWTGRTSFTYEVDGVAVEFWVATAEAEPLIVIENENREAVAFASTRQLIFTVNACAT